MKNLKILLVIHGNTQVRVDMLNVFFSQFSYIFVSFLKDDIFLIENITDCFFSSLEASINVLYRIGFNFFLDFSSFFFVCLPYSGRNDDVIQI